MEVTFLFTNVADSTALLQRLDDRRYGEVLAEHQRLLRAAFQGDAFFVAFPRAGDAVAAALAAQRAIIAHPWPEGHPSRAQECQTPQCGAPADCKT